MRCPGQDTQYWSGEVAFEAPCPKCGREVEFFKDESSGRCPDCGHKFKNPRVSFDCAKWCAYAEECLGFAPERETAPTNPGQGALASQLIRAIKEAYAPDQARIARALSMFQYAKELLAAEGGDPRIVLGAALLLETLGERWGEGDRAAQAKRILEEVGLDADTVTCICQLLRRHGTDDELDTVEARIVADCRTLATLGAAGDAGGEGNGDDARGTDRGAKKQLRTEAGKRKVQAAQATS